MRILLIDNNTTFINELKEWLAPNNITGEKFDAVSVEEGQKYDLIVLSGGHHYSVIYHNKEYSNELEIIKNSATPILGICLGFELIAFAFGCELKQLEHKEKGIIDIALNGNDPIIDGIKELKVYESHRWVVKDPRELVSLGSSKDGVEIIKHKSKLIYGFQFHPEIVVDKEIAKKLLSNFLSIISEK